MFVYHIQLRTNHKFDKQHFKITQLGVSECLRRVIMFKPDDSVYALSVELIGIGDMFWLVY